MSFKLFYSNAIFFLNINNEDKYKQSELEYININKIKEQKGNSVFKLSF